MTGAETAAAVSAGEISAVESIANALDAAEALQPALNTFNSIDREAALDRAARIDHRIGKGEPAGPMAGVAVGQYYGRLPEWQFFGAQALLMAAVLPAFRHAARRFRASA